MGSLLPPVLANLFMGHYEKLWLKIFQGSEILFYRRYVEDTFCFFHSEHDAIIFFDYINSRHPNIRFTMEKEVHHKLPFLDVLIDNNDPILVICLVKDPVPDGLRSRVVYKFAYAGCNACGRNNPEFFHTHTWALSQW